MGKKGKKKKQKKVSAKREKYKKFKKDKPGILDLRMPDLTTEEQKQKQRDEEFINKFLRFNRNRPTKEIVERRALSKRAKIRR